MALLHHLVLYTVFLVIIKSNASISKSAFQISKINKHFRSSQLRTLCNSSSYPNTCYSSLSSLMNPENSYDFPTLFNLSIQATKNELLTAYIKFGKHGAVSRALMKRRNGIRSQMQLQSCQELIDLARYYLDWVIPTNDSLARVERCKDFRTWVSAVGSLLEFCKEVFNYEPDEVRRVVIESLDKSTESASNSLAIISRIEEQIRHFPEKPGLDEQASNWPPTWLSNGDTSLLDEPNSVVPDVTVAKDGSGNYCTISDALEIVPVNGKKRFYMYVKKGVYAENIRISREKSNILMYGDGMEHTIISSNRSNSSGFTICQSAALAVDGGGFIAMYMGFRNTAGPEAHQAVALQTTADRSVFYKCKIEGYQDTLFTTSNRQFYRECVISGTVDFIFGNAAVVIQNSTILARKPLPEQRNVIAANYKNEPLSSSSISIQHCHVRTLENLECVETYLGRPMRSYATIVFMQNVFESLIDPRGWYLRKSAPSANIYFAEHVNTGPGALVTNRTKWDGVRANMSTDEANKFTVRSLISGTQWLPETGVPFQPDLYC